MAIAARATLPEPAAGLYCRISHDEAHDQLGVRRQEEDGRRELLRRGIPLHRVYVDDDLSGSGLIVRPAFTDLLEDLRSGTISVTGAGTPIASPVACTSSWS